MPFNINFRRWIYSTVIVGALPLITRIITNMLVVSVNPVWFNAVDFIFLGLTLSLTNINELNSLKQAEATKNLYKEDSLWGSVFIILFLTFTLGFQFVSECTGTAIIRTSMLLGMSVLLSILSFLHSGLIMYKLKG